MKHTDDYLRRYERLKELFTQKYNKQGNYFWGDVVVFGFLKHRDEESVFLNLLELDRDKCGQGIGTKCLTDLKASIVSCGFKRMYVYPCPLDKGTSMRKVRSFYEKNGFIRIGKTDEYCWWKGFVCK